MILYREFRASVQLTRRQNTFVISLVYEGIRRSKSLNISLSIRFFSVVECCQIGVSDFCRHECRRRTCEYVRHVLSADRRKIKHNLKLVFVHFSCLM
jgi:hypothetical protein